MAELYQKCDDNKKITLHSASNILTVTITSNEIQYQRSSQRRKTNTKPLYSFIMRLKSFDAIDQASENLAAQCK